MIQFVKYQGTGNDFVMIDDREGVFSGKEALIPALCNRRTGIGADGLILIREHPHLDFEMVYYNADGSQSMCGNGSRCAVNFASALGMIHGEQTKFLSTDGEHRAVLHTNGEVELELHDVAGITSYEDRELFLDTGSPHHIRFTDSLENYPVVTEGRTIRQDKTRYPDGTNVNFVQILENNCLFVRTYERGVEDETLSCGTGVTAASLAATLHRLHSPITVKTPGGILSVKFRKDDQGGFKDIYLQGPAVEVFRGQIEI